LIFFIFYCITRAIRLRRPKANASALVSM
jgi:hypothetical protein